LFQGGKGKKATASNGERELGTAPSVRWEERSSKKKKRVAATSAGQLEKDSISFRLRPTVRDALFHFLDSKEREEVRGRKERRRE